MRISILKAVAAAVFFGGLWGSWAYYCNGSFGYSKAMHAALTQFSFSFVATFIFTLVVDFLYERSTSFSGKVMLAFLLPVGAMLGSLVLIHFIRGTPRIMATVLPSTAVAACYCMLKIARGILSTRATTS